jgi:hypothetical protein
MPPFELPAFEEVFSERLSTETISYAEIQPLFALPCVLYFSNLFDL